MIKQKQSRSLQRPAVFFYPRVTRFIKFVRQVFWQQQTPSSEPQNRWRWKDGGTERKAGSAVKKKKKKKQSNESHKGAALQALLALASLPLLPAWQTHPSLASDEGEIKAHKREWE